MSCKIENCTREMRYPGSQLCNMHYTRFNKTGSYDNIDKYKAMVFDGSTYRTAGQGISKDSYVENKEKFILARNESVIKRLLVKRNYYNELGEYVTYAGIRRELAREIDLVEKSIAAIVAKHNMTSKMHPLDSIKPPRKGPIQPIPDLVIPTCNRKYLTQAWI